MSVGTSAITPTLAAKARWEGLSRFLNTKFYNPDLEALLVCLCATVGHYKCEGDPVWLFVVGPSSTGKTSVIINTLAGLPEASIMGDVSGKALLSGFGGQENASLLKRVGPSAIFLFKDFTTIISKRPDQRAEVIAQFRELYDGRLERSVGLDKDLSWEGKITVIAATTPAIERQWAILRDLGERFLTVRWERGDSEASAFQAMRQRGEEKQIVHEMRRLGGLFVEKSTLPPLPKMTEPEMRKLIKIAEVLVRLRSFVIRDTHGSREIIDVPEAEGAARAAKQLSLIAQGHATLFRLSSLSEESFALARRVTLDSIPSTRLKLLNLIPLGERVRQADLVRASQMALSSVQWQMEELEAMRIVFSVFEKETLSTFYQWHSDFLELAKASQLFT